MRRLAFVLVVVVCAVIAGGAGLALAQEKPAQPVKVEAPVLAEVDQLKIENALLKIDAAQKNLDTLKTSFTALLASLQRPGYVIGQGQDGKLAYQSEPKQEKQ